MSSGNGVGETALSIALIGPIGSAYSQIKLAGQQADLQREQIRQQQVQLRLQQNQDSINRLKNLRSVLATEQVQLGARGIAPNSGSIRAIFQTNFDNFQQDENASKLNFLSKNVALDTQRQAVGLERNARVMSALNGLSKDAMSIGMAAYGMPSGSLVSASQPTTSVTSGGSTNPGDNNFNLNR